MKSTRFGIEHALITLIVLLATSGCDDSSKREAAALRGNLDTISVKYQAAIEEKAKAEAEVIKLRSELSVATDRMGELKRQFEALRADNLRMLDSLNQAERRASAAENKALAEQTAANSIKQALDRRESELLEEVSRLRYKSESQKGTLSGVATYYFNRNYGYKPDIGSEVFVVPKSAYQDFDFAVLEKFIYVRRLRMLSSVEIENVALGAKLGIKISKSNILSALEKTGVATESDWKALAWEAVRAWGIAANGKSTIKLVADGNGAFKRSFPSGEYYILIKSRQRTGLNSVEILGKIHAEKVTINSDEEVSVSAKFEAL